MLVIMPSAPPTSRRQRSSRHWRLALPLLLLFTGLVGLPALTVGQPAPDLSGVAWSDAADTQARPWTLVIWWQPTGDEDPGPIGVAHELALRFGGKVAVRLVATGRSAAGPEELVRGLAVGSATPATRERWLEPGAPVPLAVLMDDDELVWWYGDLVDAPRMVELALAGTLDLTSTQALVSLEDQLRAAMQRGSLADTRRTAETLLRFDPEHETARYVELSLAREAGDHDAYREALAAIDAESAAVRFLVELAGDLITDPDLAWRAPAQTRRLAEAAHVRAPEDVGALLTLARVRAAFGDIEAAIALAERAATDAPDHPAVDDALRYYRELVAPTAEPGAEAEEGP